ncbi:IS110 family transposase [Nocardia asteroides NBRC 15531]|uniref:Transposase n=1 Tax=Nocardia asteroides NBRC 15531 TaxID=1110697 RepID=U5EAB8_NOCAS|nr:IS110 family transposase [Nocardia asteroides]TLF67670.1 IS110 family transposase [Nocardia asteroides NBRC 15531]UGT50769.1 IS110 family transposase [Nocardia asteroides]SFN82741.1 Transposase IS116/IS110/IS902 family protein [Nocardia asteroides]VEG36390.1 Transposase [Nocardia asteroides]GAD83423.1 putative transposase [Nocardia asteroides NBRC 15531]
MNRYCGIDWAEGHHDIAIVDQDGALVSKKRIGDDPAGFAALTEMLTAAGDTAEEPIPVAIETTRGLMVAALRATGRPVYAINPMAVARYRERHTLARTKSDHADAMTLANILRVDAHVHRTMPADSELAQAIAVLARAQQDAVWRRTKASNELRSLLREFYPVFLATFADRSSTNLAKPEVRAVLAIAPTPTSAAKLTKTRVAAALRRAGRKRGIDERAAEIVKQLRRPGLRQPTPVETAMGRHVLVLLAALNAACVGADELEEAAAEEFRKHPDHAIITSFPGLADLAGARVLAEIGDDRNRFATARSLKAYAGSAPVTRASGRSISITHRRIKNDRLAATGWVWAFAAAINRGPAREHYLRRRAHGDRHSAALRHLFNKMLGQLHYCLRTDQTFDPVKAFPGPKVREPLAA